MVAGESSTRPDLNVDAEIISLFARPTCPKPPDFPMRDSLALFGAFVADRPVLCGTRVEDSLCLSYDMSGGSIWHTEQFALNGRRTHASGAMLGNGSWIITGGQLYVDGAPVLLNTSEILEDDGGGGFVPGPMLPMPLSGHCTVSIEGWHMFVAGGYGVSHLRESFLLDTDDRSWRSLPMMRHGKFGHSCGRAETEFGEVKVIVTGGLRQHQTEVYLPAKQIWVDGPRLSEARHVFNTATVQGSDTFVITGGVELEPDCSTSDCRLDDILGYDPYSNSWVKSVQKMRQGRGNQASIRLPFDAECSCEFLLSVSGISGPFFDAFRRPFTSCRGQQPAKQHRLSRVSKHII